MHVQRLAEKIAINEVGRISTLTYVDPRLPRGRVSSCRFSRVNAPVLVGGRTRIEEHDGM